MLDGLNCANPDDPGAITKAAVTAASSVLLKRTPMTILPKSATAPCRLAGLYSQLANEATFQKGPLQFSKDHGCGDADVGRNKRRGAEHIAPRSRQRRNALGLLRPTELAAVCSPRERSDTREVIGAIPDVAVAHPGYAC